jgi:hypothetical protein
MSKAGSSACVWSDKIKTYNHRVFDLASPMHTDCQNKLRTYNGRVFVQTEKKGNTYKTQQVEGKRKKHANYKNK